MLLLFTTVQDRYPGLDRDPYSKTSDVAQHNQATMQHMKLGACPELREVHIKGYITVYKQYLSNSSAEKAWCKGYDGSYYSILV